MDFSFVEKYGIAGEKGGTGTALKNQLRKLIAVVLTAVFVLGFPILSSEGEASAYSGKPVRLVMLDRRDNDSRDVAGAFGAVGVRVTTVYSLKAVKPKRYDGLVIPGGLNDIDPSLYGAKDHGKNYKPDKAFDKRQIKAIKRFAQGQK